MTQLNIFRTAENKQAIPAGTVLFSEGDPPDVMYAVLSGSLEVSVRGTVVETVTEGGVVGEMALISDGESRSATLTASSDSVVVPIDEKQFLKHVHTTPFFALQVLRITAARLRRTNELL